MIASDLNLLREKDPATWEEFDSTVVAIYEGYEEIYQDGLTDRARLAWLQAVLQDAIQARVWSWRMQGFPEIDEDRPGQTCCTIMRRKGIIWYDHKTAYADSPAEALLKAYTEAIG